MEKIIAPSRWQIKEFIKSEQAQYFAIISNSPYAEMNLV